MTPPPIKGKRWEALRQAILRRDGYTCQRTGVPLRPGRKHPHSAVIHHIKPRAEAPELTYDPDNLVAVSKQWHDSQAQSEERMGYSTAIGEDGWPIDPRHPANRSS